MYRADGVETEPHEPQFMREFNTNSDNWSDDEDDADSAPEWTNKDYFKIQENL